MPDAPPILPNEPIHDGIAAGWAGAALTVDLVALRSNYALIARRVAPARTAAVVKADAYGLGARFVAPALAAEGCREFFVAHLGEALALKPLLPPDARLYLLNGLPPGAEAECAAAGFCPVLSSLDQAAAWIGAAAAAGRVLPAAVQIDSGMSRLGLPPADIARLAGDDGFLRHLRIELVMSHLACADEAGATANAAQLDRFRTMAAPFRPARLSLANSGGCFLGEAFHGDLVRPGIALYGAAPQTGIANPMRPVVRLDARVIQVRDISAGTGVGYGLTFVAPDARRIATISLGYADGWPRALGNCGAAYFDGVRLPIVGRVFLADGAAARRAEGHRHGRDDRPASVAGSGRRGCGHHRLRDPHRPGTPLFPNLSGRQRHQQGRQTMTITRLHSGPRMSQAVIHRDTVYLAGQVGAPGESVTVQAQTIVAQIDALLAEAGTDRSNLLSATIWLADMAGFAEMNAVWDAWIGGRDAPARATGEAKLATPDYKVEIIVVAALPA
jgi:alanine racemase